MNVDQTVAVQGRAPAPSCPPCDVHTPNALRAVPRSSSVMAADVLSPRGGAGLPTQVTMAYASQAMHQPDERAEAQGAEEESQQVYTVISEGSQAMQQQQRVGGRRRWNEPADDTAEISSRQPTNQHMALQQPHMMAAPPQPHLLMSQRPSNLPVRPLGRSFSRQRTMSKNSNPQVFHYYPQLPHTSEDYQDCYDGDQTSFESNMPRPYNQATGQGSDHLPSAPAWDSCATWHSADALYPGKDTGPDRSAVGSTLGATPEPSPGVVVHMPRAEAWARLVAYESCIQVCCENMSNEAAQHFMATGFQMLKENLRTGSLLLSSAAPMPQPGSRVADASAIDICWHDSHGGEVQLMVLAASKGASNVGSDYAVRVRVGGVLLPGMNIMERLKRWAAKRQPAKEARRAAQEKKNSHLVVHMASPDRSHMLQCPLDRNGCSLIQGSGSWTYLDATSGDMHADLHGRAGLVAGGTVAADHLWQLAETVEIQDLGLCPGSPGADVCWDEQPASPGGAAASGPNSAAAVRIPLTASSTQMAAGQLILEVQRVRRVPHELELAQVTGATTARGKANKAGCTTGFGTLQSDLALDKPHGAGTQTLRMNCNIAYDHLLSAALEVEKCGPGKLSIEGPWQWLLTAYADKYHVTNPYRILVHLQWILQPSIARTSQLCLTTIEKSWSFLMSCKMAGGLSPHENTLLTRIRRDVEELLKVAFTRYYIPQQEEEEEDDPPRPYELTTWDAQHLQAAVLLYQQVAPFLQPSAHDWLALCWQTAAQKRWRALMAIGDPDRLIAAELAKADTTEPPATILGRRRPMNSPIRAAGDVKMYQQVSNLCKLIQEDITFDLHLKREPGLLPDEPELPRKTAEEYLAQFLQILRLVLDLHPPNSPTPQAVDLLVAVASMQRYFDVAGLQCDKEHPGHLNAFQLFQPHVQNWISASQQRLSQQCQQLEASSKTPLGAGGVALGPSTSSHLVASMLHAVAKELQCYERVLQHWPRFCPALEAAICQVLRVVLSALTRQCDTVTGNAPYPGNPTGQTPAVLPSNTIASALPTPGHQRSATTLVGQQRWAPGNVRAYGPGAATMHKRNATTMDAAAAAALAEVDAGRSHAGHLSTVTSPRLTTADQDSLNRQKAKLAAPAPVVPLPPRMVVLLKEAVLLNSLKHIMIMVPEMEDSLTAWATWAAGQITPLTTDGQLLPDGVDIGVHFAQLVKELRTQYATAVATCAGRLADVLRGPASSAAPSNIRVALDTTRRAIDKPSHLQVSNATAQKQALEEAMNPVLIGLEDALAALQAALDVRVCIATGRALWDYVGKDLHLFVSALQETDGGSHSSAWRARQNAETAAHRIDELFCQAFTEMLNGAVQPCDLLPPAHMDKVHKLLQRNSAAVNMTFTPF